MIGSCISRGIATRDGEAESILAEQITSAGFLFSFPPPLRETLSVHALGILAKGGRIDFVGADHSMLLAINAEEAISSVTDRSPTQK